MQKGIYEKILGHYCLCLKCSRLRAVQSNMLVRNLMEKPFVDPQWHDQATDDGFVRNTKKHRDL